MGAALLTTEPSMAFTLSSPLLQTFTIRRVRNALPENSHSKRTSLPVLKASAIPGRREMLFFLTTTAAVTAGERSSRAEDIGLFGIRKGLRKAEKEAEEILKEGLEAAETGLEKAEFGIEAAEKGIESAEKGIESAVSFGGLAQAGVVA